MKTLNFEEMEKVEGGNKAAAIICGVGFAQFSFWNGLAFGLAGVSLGTTLAIAAGIDLLGAVVCAQA